MLHLSLAGSIYCVSFVLIIYLTELNKTTSDLTCHVLLFLFQHVVVIYILIFFPIFCLFCAVLHRDHSEVGGHFYTMCLLSVSPVCHTLISFSFLLPFPFCSAFPLSLFLRLTAATLLLFPPLYLSCLLFHVDLPPWFA